MACSLSDKSLLSVTQQCQLCQDSMWYGYYIPVYRLSTGIYGMFIVPNHIREFYKQNLFILSGFRSKICLKEARNSGNRDLSLFKSRSLYFTNWQLKCNLPNAFFSFDSKFIATYRTLLITMWSIFSEFLIFWRLLSQAFRRF